MTRLRNTEVNDNELTYGSHHEAIAMGIETVVLFFENLTTATGGINDGREQDNPSSAYSTPDSTTEGIEQFEYVMAQMEALKMPVVDYLYYITLVIGVMTIIGNIVVIVSILYSVKTVKPFMIFILSLAVADFLQGMFC